MGWKYDHATGAMVWIRQASKAELDAHAAAEPTHGYGLIAARPSAGTLNDKSTYYASDDNGGTLYQVQGGAWVKIAAGLSDIAGGRELPNGYSEWTNAQTFTAVADVTNGSITPTVGSRAVLVMVAISAVQNDTVPGAVLVTLTDAANTILDQRQVSAQTANQNIAVAPMFARLTPPSGTGTTYKVRCQRVTAGTAKIVAAANAKGFIQAREI